MELTLAPNPLHSEEQTLSFEKVATLIGENGSGKSCILQSIFDTKLAKNDFEDVRVVCFSSGQNENFSHQFGQYLNNERRISETLSLDSFYYDKSWSKLLIFLSTCLHFEGKVREFLRTNNYVDEEGFTESSFRKDDISTKLTVKFRVARQFIERVKHALAVEKTGLGLETLRSTPYFRTLTSFIEKNVDPEYEFQETLRKRTIEISSDTLFATSYEVERPQPEGNEETHEPILSVNPIVSFFTQLADNNYFLDRTELKLNLKGGLELDQLSDGEYQLLFLYALIDLFDDKNTLFLLDEADSHLHYQNIGRLWKTLANLKGRVITTTHLLDSISATGIRNIRVITNGKISTEDRFTELTKRFNELGFFQKAQFRVCSLSENIVLIDDPDDWIIFLMLAEKKLGKTLSDLNEIQVIKKESNYEQHTCSFGQSKISWTEAFATKSTEWDTRTKNVFLICDRDNLTVESISTDDCVSVNGENAQPSAWSSNASPKAHLLSWRHREIENYLLSYTALNTYDQLATINNQVGVDFQLKENMPSDCEQIRAMDVKKIIQPFIKTSNGLSKSKLQAYIDLIPPEEISEDIENMYNFIVSKL